MGYAMLFPEPTRNRKAGVSSGRPEDRISKGHRQNLVSQARIVLRETPELAIRVREGFSPNEAYEIALRARNTPRFGRGWRARRAKPY
jgi:hypothetical protein